MKPNKYEELDLAICDHIARGIGHPIYSSVLLDIARRLLAYNRTPFPEEWRLIDRRLQAMRKTGVLKHDRASLGGVGGWCVLKQPNARHEGAP